MLWLRRYTLFRPRAPANRSLCHNSRPQPAANFQQVPTPSNSPGAAPLARPNSPNDLDKDFIGLSGGQIFHEMMLRHKVEKVFGYPGGAILPVFDAIYNSPNFDFVLPRHEQGAGHMAEGYARVSGKPGVVLVTSGPGATNVVTPMQDALSDGTPLVVFCGQVATSAIGSDAFQEADMVGISRPCTKWNVMVKDIAELPRRINEAFKIATSGRPGPVLVDLPKDVTASILRQAIPYKWTHPELVESNLPSRNRTHTATSQTGHEAALISDSALNKAAKLIANAKRPVIYAGQGMLSTPEGPELLARLSQQGNIPVTTTLMGLGAFNENNETHSLHMLGMHGSAYANLAMQSADVIIALGARFDDRVTGKVDSELLSRFSFSALTDRSLCLQQPSLPPPAPPLPRAEEASSISRSSPRTSTRSSTPTSPSLETFSSRSTPSSLSSPNKPSSARNGSPRLPSGRRTTPSTLSRARRAS